MALLLHILKELYAYCTDFVINLSNLLGLSYYEVNFILFVILYPLIFITSLSIFILQRKRLQRLRKLNNEDKNLAETKNQSNSPIYSFKKSQIYLYVNLAWMLMIALETIRTYDESVRYYTKHLLRGDYPPEADSIAIPIFEDTFFVFAILTVILMIINTLLFITTRKGIYPSPLFILPNNYNGIKIFWELFLGLTIFVDVMLFLYIERIGFHVQGIIILFLGFMLLHIRAGHMSKH